MAATLHRRNHGATETADDDAGRPIAIPPTPADFAIHGAEQILLEKRQLNLFTNPNLPRLLEVLGADEYVVYGVVTEYCVSYAAMGLLKTGKPVTLVTDAIASLNAERQRARSSVFFGRGRQAGDQFEIAADALKQRDAGQQIVAPTGRRIAAAPSGEQAGQG